MPQDVAMVWIQIYWYALKDVKPIWKELHEIVENRINYHINNPVIFLKN